MSDVDSEGLEERHAILLAQVKRLEAKYKAANGKLPKNAGQRLDKARRELREIQKQLPPKSIVVTDHAVLRYLDRYLEIDCEQVRQLIYSILSPYANTGVSNVIKDGVTYVIQDNKVVTVTVNAKKD